MSVPKLRFPEFTDDWEQRKLGDIADVTKLAGFEFTEHVVYSDEGNIIALRGLNIKNGQLVLDDVKYIDGSNFAKLNRSKLFIDDIMFTYVGTVGEVAIIKENDRFYLAPNVSRIRVQSNDSPKFISHYMRTDSFYRHVIFPLIATSSQPALSMENIRKFEICLPKNRDEQDKLSEFFDGIDNLITLHQRKLEGLRILKKSMLQKMFPSEGYNVPEVRFPGFTAAWEQRKFGDLLDETREKTTTEDEDTLISCAINGMFLNSELFDHFRGSSNIGYLKIKKNDLILSAQNLHLGNCNVNLRFDHGIISPAYKVYRLVDCNPLFMQAWVKRDSTKLFFLRATTEGASVCRKNIVWDTLYKQTLWVPCIKEQIKIGEFFAKLDNAITLHQRKCDDLQKLKKALLQQMFC